MSGRRRVERVLVAARGAEALRILRSLHEADLEGVCLLSERDGEASWADDAEYAVFVGADERGTWPGEAKTASAGLDAGCDVVHPGTGPLAQDPAFAMRVAQIGLGYAGPKPEQVGLCCQPDRLLTVLRDGGIPTVPMLGAGADDDEAGRWLERFKPPVLVHQVEPDGHAVSFVAETREAAMAARRAGRAVGHVSLEHLPAVARDVEVVIIGDGQGEVLTVGDCAVTAWHEGRPLVAECPTPGLDPAVRQSASALALRVGQRRGWLGLGSVRLSVAPDGRTCVRGVRPGLAAWHGVIEAVFGVDLVDAQIRLVSGENLGWTQDAIAADGAAMEVLLTATADTGAVGEVKAPSGVRVWLGVGEGDAVEAGEALGDVTAHAPTRQAAIVRAKAALDGLHMAGVTHSGEQAAALLGDPGFWRGAARLT